MTSTTETESKNGFTPGPWRIVGTATIRAGNGWTTANVHWRNREANARLIAAAPDLLTALKYARRFLNSKDHDTAFVDCAIARATGEA